MYASVKGRLVGPLLFVDNNLSPVSLTYAEQLQPNIIIGKTTAFTINTPVPLCDQLWKIPYI
jgi:hypothetical protein